jgi:hypothetical protein
MRDRALLRGGDGRARGDAAGSHRDVRYRPPQHVLSRQPAGVRGGRDGSLQGTERRAARGPDLHHQVASRHRRASAAQRYRIGVRSRLGAGIHGRPFGGRAAALHDARHARSGDPDLRERTCSAAAVGQALLRPRPDDQARDRELAGGMPGSRRPPRRGWPTSAAPRPSFHRWMCLSTSCRR